MPGSRLSMGMATAAGAQASTGTEIAQANTEDEGDDSIKYRLAGRLGLLGLAGLFKRDRHDDHRAPGNGRGREVAARLSSAETPPDDDHSPIREE